MTSDANTRCPYGCGRDFVTSPAEGSDCTWQALQDAADAAANSHAAECDGKRVEGGYLAVIIKVQGN